MNKTLWLIEEMYVVCFGDGLGNQMFQYAFYKALQVKYPENNVYMDVFRIYGNYIHNGFELSKIFGIDKNEVDFKEALRLADRWPKNKVIFKIMNKFLSVKRYIFGKKACFITQDDPTGYYEDVFRLPDIQSYMFCGNWVNEKYFKDIKEVLLEEFCFPDIKDEKNLNYVRYMKSNNSVSVHIRKGDYVDSKMINLSVEYYKCAKTIIENKVSNPLYFIFTDDKNAIAEYLDIFDNYIIVEGNVKEESFRDMQLMSICKHNIIANSTFSFWGAYLNKNVGKIVIAPSKAKADFKHPFACDEWIVIPYDKE